MAQVKWMLKATKQLLSIEQRYQKAISDKVDDLTGFPSPQLLNIIKLEGSKDKFRLRVGDYRVIFQVSDGKPVVCTIHEVKRRTSKTY